MHLKRLNIGKFWPVPRKGTKYLAVSSHNKKNSIPLIVVMRDILKLVRTKRELKKILNEKQIKMNEKQIRDVNYPVGLFDIISIKSMNKNYRSSLYGNKISFEEVSGNELKKVIKVIGKKVLKNNIVQFNLSDGRNFILNRKEKLEINDSVLFNFNKGIEKVIKMEKGNRGFVIKGKHAGVSGKIEDIIDRGGKKLVVINNDEKINVWIKNVIAIE